MGYKSTVISKDFYYLTMDIGCTFGPLGLILILILLLYFFSMNKSFSLINSQSTLQKQNRLEHKLKQRNQSQRPEIQA
jgi:hypothetical protein